MEKGKFEKFTNMNSILKLRSRWRQLAPQHLLTKGSAATSINASSNQRFMPHLVAAVKIKNEKKKSRIGTEWI